METCENCQTEIIEKYASGRFCSSKCARGFSTKANRKEINAKVSASLSSIKRTPFFVTIICEVCSSEFIKPFRNRKTRHCSKKCTHLNPEFRERLSIARSSAIQRGLTNSYGTKSIYNFNGTLISCDSNIERACLNYFEVLGATYMRRSDLAIPYIHCGVKRRFLPDFIIELDGRHIIAEAKSYCSMNSLNEKWNDYNEKSILKKIALEEYCMINNLEAFWFTPKMNQKYYSSIIGKKH